MNVIHILSVSTLTIPQSLSMAVPYITPLIHFHPYTPVASLYSFYPTLITFTLYRSFHRLTSLQGVVPVYAPHYVCLFSLPFSDQQTTFCLTLYRSFHRLAGRVLPYRLRCGRFTARSIDWLQLSSPKNLSNLGIQAIHRWIRLKDLNCDALQLEHSIVISLLRSLYDQESLLYLDPCIKSRESTSLLLIQWKLWPFASQSCIYNFYKYDGMQKFQHLLFLIQQGIGTLFPPFFVLTNFFINK